MDVADLADLGEPVVTAMTALGPALEAKKVDDARALATTVVHIDAGVLVDEPSPADDTPARAARA